jgi:hypothetical protein
VQAIEDCTFHISIATNGRTLYNVTDGAEPTWGEKKSQDKYLHTVAKCAVVIANMSTVMTPRASVVLVRSRLVLHYIGAVHRSAAGLHCLYSHEKDDGGDEYHKVHTCGKLRLDPVLLSQ